MVAKKNKIDDQGDGVTPKWLGEKLAEDISRGKITAMDIEFRLKEAPDLTATYNGLTPFLAAIHTQNISIAKTLLRHGSLIDETVESSGNTALIVAVRGRNPKVVEWLLQQAAERGYDAIGAKAADGSNAMHAAAIGGKLDLIKKFMTQSPEHWAVKDRMGLTPWDQAERYHHPQVAAYFSEINQAKCMDAMAREPKAPPARMIRRKPKP